MWILIKLIYDKWFLAHWNHSWVWIWTASLLIGDLCPLCLIEQNRLSASVDEILCSRYQLAVTESDLLMLFSTSTSLWEIRKVPTLPFGYPKLTAVSMCISGEGMTGISVMKCEIANIWWIALLFPFGCFLLCISLLFLNRLSSHLSIALMLKDLSQCTRDISL